MLRSGLWFSETLTFLSRSFQLCRRTGGQEFVSNAQPVPRVRGLPAPSALASASSFLSGSWELVSCRWLADRLFPFRTGTRKPRWAGSARWHPRKETRKRKRGRGRRRTREGKGGRRRSKAPLRGALQPLRQRWPAAPAPGPRDPLRPRSRPTVSRACARFSTDGAQTQAPRTPQAVQARHSPHRSELPNLTRGRQK